MPKAIESVRPLFSSALRTHAQSSLWKPQTEPLGGYDVVIEIFRQQEAPPCSRCSLVSVRLCSPLPLRSVALGPRRTPRSLVVTIRRLQPRTKAAKILFPERLNSSLPTRGGKQEPSSKAEGTEANAPILNNGVLTAPGAPQDSQTAPAKFSKRSDEVDKLSIAAYALIQLSTQQRDRLHQALNKPTALSDGELGSLSEVGAEIPSSSRLKHLEPLPEQLVSELPELKSLFFVRVRDKIVLVDPVLHRVLAVLNQ